jgi:hypothetical protein
MAEKCKTTPCKVDPVLIVTSAAHFMRSRSLQRPAAAEHAKEEGRLLAKATFRTVEDQVD